MIQSALPVASTSAEIHSVNPSSGAADKGFMSVLKTSVLNAGESGNGGETSEAQDTASTKAAILTGSQVSDDATNIKDNSRSRQTEDPLEILQQLLLQMTGAASQMITQPVIKGVSAEAQAAQSLPVAPLSLLNVNESERSSLPLQNAGGTQAVNPGDNNPGMYLSALTANAVKSADKLADTLNNALTGSAKSPQQGNMSNLLSGAEGSAKAESVFKSFELGGKDAASIARLSGSSGDEFSQLKLETGAGQASREGNSSKDASTLYAQTVQTLHSSTGAGPAQETVPVSRLTSMDEVISKAVDAGQKNLVIRIDPPDLGNVQIRLSLDNGVLKAEVRVDSSIVKDAFNLVIPQIKTSLENSGIKVSEFHVDVRDDQNGNGQANNDNNKQKQRQDGEARNAFSGFFA